MTRHGRLVWAFVTALVVLAFSNAPRADAQMTVEVGTAAFETQNSSLILMGYTLPAKDVLGIDSYWQYNAGVWEGRRAASVFGLARGLEWRFGDTRLRLSTGPSFISETNDRVSTPIEFYEQLLIEQRIANVNVALSYRHWSNADFKSPNLGMDFVGIQISQQWR